MPMNSIKFSLSFPPFEISGTWEFDKKQKEASWKMYVELVTRIAVIDLDPDEGLLREALSSFYSLFDITRNILKEYGPSIVKKSGKGGLSFGYIAVSILNFVLRPLLAKWHPLLLDYESSRDPKISQVIHEKNWEHNDELRKEIKKVQEILKHYAQQLEQVIGIQSLVVKKPG